MSAIVDFFASLIDIILALVNLLVTLVRSVFWVVVNLPQLISGVTAAFSYCPDFLLPFLSASVALLVVFCIMRML